MDKLHAVFDVADTGGHGKSMPPQEAIISGYTVDNSPEAVEANKPGSNDS